MGNNCCVNNKENKLKTTEQFIIDSKKVHGDRYDYSKVEYIGSKNSVTIICPIHGEFEQRPNNHLIGQGCPHCSKSGKQCDTLEDFIRKAREKHGDKYDYSHVVLNKQNKILIKCNKCGTVFEQKPSMHLIGNGCPSCNKFPKKISKEEYSIYFKEKYPTLELLSEYDGNKNYITVRCKIHDYVFNTKPNWLKSGSGCKLCYHDRMKEERRSDINTFIENAKLVHGDKYNYSKVDYVNNRTKVCIICPIHGEFWITPNKHLIGRGCKYCSIKKQADKRRLSIEEFIKRSKEVHGDKYDYSKVEYTNCDTLVSIICPIHGEFKQTPYTHINGCGCPACKQSHLEREVEQYLINHNIQFERQKKFDWLGRQTIDFYLLDYNTAIECQGEQHFKSVEYFGGQEGFNERIILDINKNNKLLENNVKILYIISNKCENYCNNLIFNNIYNQNNVLCIENLNKLIDVIKSN